VINQVLAVIGGLSFAIDPAGVHSDLTADGLGYQPV
jgi:hypothetical protein